MCCPLLQAHTLPATASAMRGGKAPQGGRRSQIQNLSKDGAQPLQPEIQLRNNPAHQPRRPHVRGVSWSIFPVRETRTDYRPSTHTAWLSVVKERASSEASPGDAGNKKPGVHAWSPGSGVSPWVDGLSHHLPGSRMSFQNRPAHWQTLWKIHFANGNTTGNPTANRFL